MSDNCTVGIFSSLGESACHAVGTEFQVCTGIKSIDNGEVREKGSACRAFIDITAGLCKVGKDEIIDLFLGYARIVLGLILGSLLSYERNGESGDIALWFVACSDLRIRRGLVFIHIGKCHVEQCPVCQGLCKIVFLFVICRILINCADHVIRSLDKHIHGTPGNVGFVRSRAYAVCRATVSAVPVVTRITGSNDFTGNGVQRYHDSRPCHIGLILLSAINQITRYHLCRNCTHHGRQSRRGRGKLLLGCGVAHRECLLDATAAKNHSQADNQNIYKYLFHINDLL